jgi:hypothetical protein
MTAAVVTEDGLCPCGEEPIEVLGLCRTCFDGCPECGACTIRGLVCDRCAKENPL